MLLLGGLPSDVMVKRLLHAWNPCAELDKPGNSHRIAEGVRWFGPFRLDAVGASEAGLPLGWSTAYAAQTTRSRLRVPDGPGAEELRRRYPHGLPAGTEAVAWSLVTGLARRLDGAARLPADEGRTRLSAASVHSSLGSLLRDLRNARSGQRSARGTEELMVLRPRKQQRTYCVYGNEALPWSVLRSVLRLTLPELDRNGALAVDDYCLDRPGSFEVRVEPFRDGEFLPYALRPQAASGWPCAVYRFRCLPQSRAADAERIDVQLRGAACRLAEVVGGASVDGEGFPITAEAEARTGAQAAVPGMMRRSR